MELLLDIHENRNVSRTLVMIIDQSATNTFDQRTTKSDWCRFYGQVKCLQMDKRR